MKPALLLAISFIKERDTTDQGIRLPAVSPVKDYSLNIFNRNNWQTKHHYIFMRKKIMPWKVLDLLAYWKVFMEILA